MTRPLPAETAEAHEIASLPGLAFVVHGSLAACEADWRRLERRACPSTFQTFAWASAWVAAFGADEGVALRIVVGRRAGEPCLIVPLALERRFGARVLGWLGGCWNDYNAPLVAADLALPEGPEAVARLWREIAALAGPADLVELAKEAPSLGGGRINALRHPTSTAEDNSAFALDLTPDMAHGLRFGGRTLSGLDRKWRKLAREGALAIERLPRGHAAAEAVRAMLDWKERTLHERGASNPFADPRSRTFLAGFAQDPQARSRTVALFLDGEPIAVTLCLEEEDELLIYQTAYDRRFARGSPGAQLLSHLIRTAAAEGLRRLDFAFGEDGYKNEICNRRTVLTRALVPLSPLGGLVAAGSRARLSLRRAVKGNDLVYRTALRVSRALRNARAPAAPPQPERV